MFFLVPLCMLAAAVSLCFVGCAFQTGGLAQPYSNNILAEPSLVAYWPLSDFPGAAPPPVQGSSAVGVALDLSGKGHNGTYTIPPAYQMGATIPQIANPTPQTGLNLRQTSIVLGDAVTSGSKNPPACVDFEGGYVNIPWAVNSPSLADFTIEAWIKPKWNVTGFDWVVFAGITPTTGFAVYINTNNNWEFSIGNGMGLTTIDTMVPAAVDGSLRYVAVTFQSATQSLSLWLNPNSDSDSNTPSPPTPAWPPSPPSQTNYVAIDPTQPMTFFIGAGATQLPPRTQPMGNGSPEAPFQGLIQSVALYNAALDPTDLASHFENGAA